MQTFSISYKSKFLTQASGHCNQSNLIMIIPINLPQSLTLFDPSINVHGGPPSERYKTTSQDETKRCLKPTGLVCTQEEHNFLHTEN